MNLCWWRKLILSQQTNHSQKGTCQGIPCKTCLVLTIIIHRDQLKITLKIFLHDCDVTALFAAVKAALSKLATNRVDMLFLATPIEVIPHIGIGSGTVGPEQEEAKEQLQKLWKGVEQLIGEGKVGGAGLCDLHPPVFIQIYEEAEIKPVSIQVGILSIFILISRFYYININNYVCIISILSFRLNISIYIHPIDISTIQLILLLKFVSY